MFLQKKMSSFFLEKNNDLDGKEGYHKINLTLFYNSYKLLNT